MENLGIFNDHFVYFTAIWEIFYGHLVYFVVIWHIFPRFGILDQKKNLATLCPARGLTTKIPFAHC
jgi:hypothetical protein